MTAMLMDLIAEATQTLEPEWVMVGGRSCPKDYPVDCSQPVFMIPLTGEYDYGEPGGPGHQHCSNHCRHNYTSWE
jgi:hypothetical protein